MPRAGPNRGKPQTYPPSGDVAEWTQTEEALRKSEERWRSVFENSAIGVALTDLNGRFLATNPIYQKMLGYTEEEFERFSFLEITHEDYREANWALVTELLEGKREQFQIEKQYRRKDGSLVWVRNNVSLVPGTESMPRFIMALSEDITERKKVEEALRNAEEFQRRLIACSEDCIKVLDLEGRLLSMNEGGMQALEICDLSPFVDSSWIDFWQGEDREAAQAAVEAARNGGTGRFIGYFATTVTKQPRWWDVVVSPIREAEGKPERLLAVSRDVTKHKQDEQALREAQAQIARSEERVRLVLDSTAEAIFGCDPDGTCLFCNPAAVRLLGYDEPIELLGKNMHALEHHTRKDGTPFPLEECPIYVGFHKNLGVHIDDDIFWRKDGTSFPVEYWSHPMVRNGRTVGAVITFFDITERKKAEEALRKSEERNRTLLEINNAIITNLTQEALFVSAYEAIRRVVPFDRAAFLLYQPETKTLRLHSMDSNVESEFFRLGKEYDLEEASVSAWALEQQQPVVRGDLEKEQQSAGDRRLVAEGIQSYCVVPLVVMGNSIGIFTVWNETKNRYSEADAELLQEVSNQVALAIANMKSYEEIAALKSRLEKENVYLQEEIRTEHNFEEIVGNSPTLLELLRRVDHVAPTDSSVLIYGETGTGKELIARAIHYRSARKNRPLVKVNCSAISAGLVESELFGHVKGAFTGAIERRIGRFELADGGTLFLDEVGELPLETQVKLLRVLQEREFEPVGSNRSVRVDVRIIAATNRNLQESISAGRFRSDLFYRLNVFPLEVPPLRERRADIPQLAMFFLSRYSRNLGKRMEGISAAATERFKSYSWPGNVRELQNVIERALILSHGPILELDPDLASVSAPEVLPDAPSEAAAETRPREPSPAMLPTLEEVERAHISAVLQQTRGVIEGANGAAKTLGMHPNTLRHRMEKLGIKRSAHRIS
jgi:formate hydrogenlyase transcriptional activator